MTEMIQPAVNAVSPDTAWRRTAKSRLRFELGGLAFACQKGFKPEDYARHLWSKGAARWMGEPEPSAAGYLLKEAEAFRCFYPGLVFEITKTEEGAAELLFRKGCLAGVEDDRWKLARSLGLSEWEVCAYCGESFRVWAGQLGLKTHLESQSDGTCKLSVVKS